MRKIRYHRQFKKDYKLAIKRGCNPELFKDLIALLSTDQTLPAKYKDHRLTDSKNYSKMRECHIQPDWLLVYYTDNDELILTLVRTGSHSDLF